MAIVFFHFLYAIYEQHQKGNRGEHEFAAVLRVPL